ncbi:hypothetical protein BJY01DRAFT_242320 [Aspergillus pseudoustus]|uniref:Methyltransferase domain-containing protein n=1 Tax=Aspergillus pseudoustus TaxID=1810923 RepID=A0ABR4KY79_9EURO
MHAGRIRAQQKGAPDYDDPSFWDTKFATGQDIGEWLNSGEVLLDAVVSFLERFATATQNRPRVLHLGPGISKLGAKVRDAFSERGWMANGIVNVDFSSEAVRLGQETEHNQDPSQAMHWQRADLRSWTDVSHLLPFAPFDVILDKSTSDAIATASPVRFTPELSKSEVCPTVQAIIPRDEEAVIISPVELLAMHLVPLTRKGSKWFVLSYSTMRFDNLSDLCTYWEIVSRIPLQAPCGQTASGAYTPPIYHWMYTLERK